MSLMTNSNSLELPVTLGNGRSISMQVYPGEVWYNESGYVQLFSMEFDDGRIGNFILRKNGTSRNQVLEFFKKYLVPLGLNIAGGVIKEKNKNHPNIQGIKVAVYLGEKYGSHIIGEILDDIDDYINPSEWGYYEISTGEYVITHPVQIALA
jgi:hypothetical protein